VAALITATPPSAVAARRSMFLEASRPGAGSSSYTPARGDLMPTATWNGAVLAESDATIVVEGNHYFPPDSVDPSYLRDSGRTSVCLWKGTARCKDVVVNGQINAAAAWYYPDPSDAATEIAGYCAFWHGVEVQE
jgi:uncharacterized protein (DUF427 family)